MTSQPDPKDGPPTLRDAAEALVAALDACKPTLDGYAVMAHVHGERYTGPTFGKEWEALRAALRVVPPEGGPRPITKEHLDVAIKAADADYQQTADWRMDAEHSDDLRRRSAMFAALTAVWALRASGAGTRQEEPPLDECDIVPEEGHSQQHAKHCRSRNADAVCKCGKGLYDGHIPPLGGEPPQ